MSNSNETDSIVFSEVQLLLAEKRTSLSVLRTGFGVLVLPMSLIGFLIATSKYYDPAEVLHYIIPLGILNVGLVVLGVYLILRSLVKMRRYDKSIHIIKQKFSVLEQFID